MVGSLSKSNNSIPDDLDDKELLQTESELCAPFLMMYTKTHIFYIQMEEARSTLATQEVIYKNNYRDLMNLIGV